ncbi:MAG: H-NS histone family protein [Rhodobacteraceae bacterium]|jgi:DNA-binding protein H-NS|nr:H-NS histone family protein [Paracoccaceae bacterium]MCC5967397.1 H-NS histone family protein [Natronohydrobacter sp.]TVR47369.1 MAG: H-NS histone family protein [Paracoccaceae bacterium]
MSVDLNEMELSELKKLQKDVTKAIESFEDRKRKEALAEVDALARERGFTIEQLVGVAPPRSRKPVAPKYANPADPSQTWTGRGRKPKWVVAALNAGKTLDDLAI